MNELNERTVPIQVLMETVLARLSEDPVDQPVAFAAEFPAHFPPVAVEEAGAVEVISELVNQVMAWTVRREVRIKARIVSTGGLPGPYAEIQGSEKDPASGGPWALITISDQEYPFASKQVDRDGDFPSRKVKQKLLQSYESRITDLGGSIWSDYLSDDAVSISIALPLQDTDLHETDLTRVRETVESRIGGGDEDSIKLLLQVETAEVQELLVESFLNEGYQIVSARSGMDILALARREVPDLIILDLQSRNPTAMDLAMMIKQEALLSDKPILFLTEFSGPGIGRRMETVDFLVQPAGAKAIVETVDRVLQSQLKPAARVMVVEPQDDLREEMLNTIQVQGYPVVEARSAEEALALAERLVIGAVLVKADLAQARDYWLVRQLRQLSEEIDIYLMTEGALAENEDEALIRGATGYGNTGRLRELLEKVENDNRRQKDED